MNAGSISFMNLEGTCWFTSFPELRVCAEVRKRRVFARVGAPAKHLAPRLQLYMDLKPNYSFKFFHIVGRLPGRMTGCISKPMMGSNFIELAMRIMRIACECREY